MRIIAALFLMTIAPLSAAQSTFVGQVDVEYRIREGDSTAAARAPLDVTIVTDYSSISVELSWDVDLTVAGGPDEPFETRLVAAGRYYTSIPLNLSFPDASGTTSTADTFFDWENEFSVIERIVTFEDRSDSETLSGQSFYQRLSFGVGNYPQDVSFSGFSSQRQLGSLLTSTGEEISLSLAYYNGPFSSSNAFVASLTELLPGDFNSNGLVEAGDFNVWRDAPGFLAPLLTDYGVWRDNFRSSPESPIVPESTPVPEPSSLAVAFLFTAAIGLSVLRQR